MIRLKELIKEGWETPTGTDNPMRALARKYLKKYMDSAMPPGSVDRTEQGAFIDGFEEGYTAAKKGE